VTKEHLIIFNGQMLKAILSGNKQMTRRVIKPQPIDTFDIENWFRRCPYGKVGDRLGVKETHYRWGHWAKNGLTKAGKQAWKFVATNNEIAYLDHPPSLINANRSRNINGWIKRPSIFLHKRFIRIWLEITEVRVERVQEITEDDAIKEGIIPKWKDGIPIRHDGSGGICREAFARLWDSLDAKRGYGWEVNPWVFVLEFKQI